MNKLNNKNTDNTQMGTDYNRKIFIKFYMSKAIDIVARCYRNH